MKIVYLEVDGKRLQFGQYDVKEAIKIPFALSYKCIDNDNAISFGTDALIKESELNTV